MSMKKLMEGVRDLTRRELVLANENHPFFASNHEGWAVVWEEYVEAEKELQRCRDRLDSLMYSVFSDDEDAARLDAEEAYTFAQLLACEAIQVAAMCQKFTASQALRESGKQSP